MSPAADRLERLLASARQSHRHLSNQVLELDCAGCHSSYDDLKTLKKKRLHEKDCLFWVKNSGRFVSKQQGPAMFLRKHGLVRKVGKTKK